MGADSDALSGRAAAGWLDEPWGGLGQPGPPWRFFLLKATRPEYERDGGGGLGQAEAEKDDRASVIRIRLILVVQPMVNRRGYRQDA